MIYYLDLFAGIGGFALGAYWSGLRFEKHYFSEIDSYCVKLYQMRFPEAIFLGDIRKIDTSMLPIGSWIITGGFPCQNISIAGKGKGIEGERSGLWFEMWCIIRDLRPQYAIIENVGAVTFRGLDRVLGSLAEIGYDAEWQDIRASDVGAPHKRERIWIVAYPSKQSGRKDTRTTSQRQTKKNNKQPRCTSKNVADTTKQGLERESSERELREWHKGLFTKCPRWAIEPDVDRLVDGLSTVLDCNIRRYGHEYSNDKETLTEIDRYRREVLRGMWKKRQATPTPYKDGREFCYSLVSPMSYEISHEEWYLGQRIAENQELRDMWKRICTEPFQETQDMQWKMLERIREIERTKKMAENRANRLKALGNSIVPQIAELLFRQIGER